MPRVTKFIKSAVHKLDYPAAGRPEVALVGRSNAGKSSLLNALAGRKTAMVSRTPGKTRLLNFFEFGDHYRFVDMPGYGFASRSGSEVLGWQTMIAEYFENRETLAGVVLIMDARREWQDEEAWITEWCEKLNLPILVVLSKADKFSRHEQNQALEKKRKILPGIPVHLVSSLKKTGIKELEDDIYAQFIKEGGR